MADHVKLGKSEIVFDTPEIQNRWRHAIYEGIPAQNHERHQAGVLLVLANIHRSFGSSFVCSIHDMGIGNWSLIRSQTTAAKPMRRVITAIENFGETSNQAMARYASECQAQIIADLTRADGVYFERCRARARFTSDALSIYGSSIFSCKADEDVTRWLQGKFDAAANNILHGNGFIYDEINKIGRAVKLLKLWRLRSAA